MKLILTETLHLEVHKLPFELSFAWNKKRGEINDWWFTPTGKCKIYFQSLRIRHLGEYHDNDFPIMVKEMKKYRSDILVDSRGNYYTIASDRIGEIINLNSMLRHMTDEWNARKYIESWGEINVETL